MLYSLLDKEYGGKSMNNCDWWAGLLSNYNFWGTVIGAFIGGFFALLIALLQVRHSEKAHEKARKENVKHELEMKLIRIQLKECAKSIGFLSSYSSVINNIEMISYEVMKEKIKDIDKGLVIQKDQVELITESMFKLLELESSAKICDMGEEVSEKCIKLMKYSDKLFNLTILEADQQLMIEAQSIEKYKSTKVSLFENVNKLVDSLNESFRLRYEELVNEFRKGLS